ncbi:hypothetical protein ACFV4M_22030 [Kitasatospora indigofera]|uniref:hypothetical protein n=1 Tax=Kitasatospora indigofera TaxID=67307 RepID=UPI00365E3678
MVDQIDCPACGSSDTVRLPTPEGWRSHRCVPCERSFEPRTCPHCGSRQVEGSLGVAGAIYTQAPVSVGCKSCGARLPLLTEAYGQGQG